MFCCAVLQSVVYRRGLPGTDRSITLLMKMFVNIASEICLQHCIKGIKIKHREQRCTLMYMMCEGGLPCSRISAYKAEVVRGGLVRFV